VDLCLNIPEVQTTVPTGLVVNDNGDCVEPPVDICPNLENLQTVMPTGYHLSDGLCVPDAVDLCLNIPEVQTTVPTGLVVNDNGDCVEPPVDICPNLENLQTEVPTGYVLVDGLCLIPVVDQCPNIPEVQNEIPSGMVKDDSGNCVTPIVDICPNIPEVQTVVPTGYHLNTENQCVPDGDSDPDPVCENPKAQNYGEKGTCVVYTSACVAYPANLLTNGSFEEPTPTANGGQWEIFSSITGWIATNGIEIWNNLIPASHGNQNAELDTTGPTKITQSVATVPGATYELRFDFAARSGADNAIEATASTSVIQSVTTSNTSWVTYGGTFVATGALTDVSFEDKGVTPNSLGTLVDNAVLCLVDLPDDNGGDDEEVLSCELTVDDAAIRRGGDVTLSWTSVGASFANLLNNSVATSGELFIEDIDEDTTYTLTVYDKRENPATCSVTVDTRSGGGGGTRVDRDRDGEVLGDSDSVEPTPLVLGEQVSAVPLGAADAGAGSTAPKTVEFFRLAPVAFIRRK
ncbi:MAG: DUF642 domain-containing protein, partial [Candidatus Pacebacteria bacterium]|nr:DUF642 domain-containing protein [Candidatus Paceibacterota bacterium]